MKDLARDASQPAAGAELASSAFREERFRLLVESITDYAIFLLSPEGFVTSWNAGAQRLKGYTAQEIIGTHFSVFYGDADRARRHPENELRLAVQNGTYGEEGWRFRKDGTRFWASVLITTLRDPTGRHVGFAKVTRDMTDRRRAEELLRQSEERLRLLVESVTDYAIFMLDPDGVITTWNTGAETINGYRADEVLGRHFRVFYSPEDAAARRPERELEIATREGRFEEEGWRVRKDGARIWVNVVLTAVHDPITHELRGFAKVTRDLTERRRLEQESRRALEQAAHERARAIEAQNALRTRDEFLSVAAHELRTPLTALQLKVQGLLQHQGSQAKLQDRLHGALRHTRRLAELVDRLLDVTRIIRGQLALFPEATELAALAQQVIDDLGEPAEQAGCELRLEAQPAHGEWDRQRLEQVLVNLLSNAIKYGAGQPVEVRVEALQAGARLSVRDHGIGIAPQDSERIFGRFERAVPTTNYGGMGLGLYVTRNIIVAHGGTIRVDSTPGQGATFIVELPARPPDGEPHPADEERS